jgi:uncharacterized protein
LRVVLDPNVFVSAALSATGPPADIIRAWRDGRFELVVSPLLMAELARVLRNRKLEERLLAGAADEIVRRIRAGATSLDDATHEPPIRAEDPDDDYLIALSATARAALVSGDRHLLRLADRIPVYTPAAFLASLR